MKKRVFYRFFLSHPRLADLAFALLFGFFLALVACTAFSPLYPAENFSILDGDSNLFRYFGQLMLEGKTPYLDFYDHKGIYHLSIMALGLWLGRGSRYGIWFLNILCLSLDLYFLFRSCRLLSGSEISYRLFAVLFFGMLYVFDGEGGDEAEWMIPYIALFLYGYLRAISNQSPRWFLFGSFFMGLEVGCAFNSRPLDALWGGVGAIAYLVYYFRYCRNRDLLFNVLIALGGFALPFLIIYPIAYSHGFLSEMVYALFVQSSHYAIRLQLQFNLAWILLLVLILALLAFFVLSYRYENKKHPEDYPLNEFFLVYGVSAFLLLSLFCSSFHYFAPSFGFLALSFVHFFHSLPAPDLKRKSLRIWSISVSSVGLAFALAIVLMYYAIPNAFFNYADSLEMEEGIQAIQEADKKEGGDGRNNRIFGIDVDPIVYLTGNLRVDERYLAFTVNATMDNPNVADEIKAYLADSSRPEWVLYGDGEFIDGIYKTTVVTYYAESSIHSNHFTVYHARAD